MTFSPDNYSAIADLSVAFVPQPVDDLGEDELLAAGADLAEIARRAKAQSALVAARIADLSRPELGDSGLARKVGARTPEHLLQNITGVSSRDAHTLITVGAMLATSAPSVSETPGMDATPWLSKIAAAVSSGRLTLEAADAIRAALGSPNDAVSAGSLAAAASLLLNESDSLTFERLAARARELRATLDLDGVPATEAALRDKRYLRMWRRADGLAEMHAVYDPESSSIVFGAFDAALSPRRGPRFVNPEDKARAEELVRDPRTNEQLALDTFVDLIRIGTLADDGTVLGSRKPAVQVLVTDADLRARRGVGFIDGQSEVVSIDTVERLGCADGFVPIAFSDDGQGMNVGITQRFHTTRQRIPIAARDGGCLMLDCERPPSWCEVHHIVEWQHGGETSVQDGVLLCRYHHHWMHNQGWRIIREDSDYFAVPPASIDAQQQPVALPSKSRAHQRLMAAAAG
jgi:hypothetical protein